MEMTCELLLKCEASQTHPYDERQPTDMNHVVQKSIDVFCLIPRGIIIHRRYQKNLWIVDTDCLEMEKALLGIFTNAWKSTAVGERLFIETLNVISETDSEGGELRDRCFVCISVTDMESGMGDQEFLPHADFSLREGEVLFWNGIAYAYSAVRRYGGKIAVQRHSGKGTTLRIFLPASGNRSHFRVQKRERDGVRFEPGS